MFIQNKRILYLFLGFVFSFNIGSSQVYTNFSSSNLPIVIIDTNGQTIVDDPKIPAHMGIIDNGPTHRNNITDSFNNFNGSIGIEIRGSSSQMFPKKQYSIQVQDINGNGIDASLLGMPKKDDWILYAAYDDKTLLRDVLAYRMGRQMGRYASRSRFVEVVINGQYQGVYILLEKIKRDKNRVNIAKLDNTSTSGDNLTGGYIIKIDKTTGSGGAGWSSPYKPVGGNNWQNINFLYDYPKPGNIAPEQQTYIQQYVNAFESALHGTQYQDPALGYARYADRDSFIDYFIMNEITKNPDGYRLSTFFYKKRDSDGGKIFMGPIWDYNEGFGNVDYCTQGTTDGLAVDFNTICPNDNWQVPFWWKKLLMDSSFKTHLAKRWQSLRAGSFATAHVLAYIDSASNVLNQEAQQRNFQCWPILGTYVWPNYFVGPTYQSEINWLKNWVSDRLFWLDTHLPSLVTSIENTSGFTLRAFPNPFHENLHIEYESDSLAPVHVEIYNTMGEKVLEVIHQESGLQSVSIPFLHLASGVYILKVTQNDKKGIQRIIKK